MKTRLLILAIVVCLVGGGCAPRYSATLAGPVGPSAEAESTIQEMVARNLIQRESSHEVVFLAFGESRFDCVDPPEGFLARLADMDVPLEPISRFDGLSDPNAPLLLIGPIAWTTEAEASLSVIRVRLGVGASDGFAAQVERTDGLWRIAKTSRHWGS